MPGFGPVPDDFATGYAQDMAAAAALYADALAVASTLTGGANMTQSGGMCLLIECRLEGGWLWISDEDDTLPWNRCAHHTGWSVAVFAGVHRGDQPQDPLVFVSTGEAGLSALRSLLLQALGQFARAGAAPSPASAPASLAPATTTTAGP